MVTATLPGVVIEDMPEAEYHARPELSSGQARTLLRSPARYRWELEHPREQTDEMLMGSCLHTEVLGAGWGWTVIDGNRNAKAVQAQITEAQEAGLIVLKSEQAELVRDMAAAVKAHPEAGALFAAGAGVAEETLIWNDPATGVACRARLDWRLTSRRGIVDLKSTVSADPADVPKHLDKFGYHIQQAHYEDGARLLGVVEPESAWRWVFVERARPHFVSVITLDPEGVATGRHLAARARERLRDCREVGLWPTGYPEHTVTVSLPPWSRRDIEESAW